MIKQLKHWIDEHDKLKAQMNTGEAYYNQLNTEIMKRKKEMGMAKTDKNGNKVYYSVEDPFASNEKLPSGFLKQHIKQKVNYLINDKMTLSDQYEETKELFPDFKNDIKKLATKASYHIYGAWQFYIEDRQLKYKYIEGNQIYPIWTTDHEVYDLVLRHYTDNGIERAILYSNKVELHYEKQEEWVLVEEKPVVRINSTIGDDVVSQNAVELSQPPLAIFFNNDEWKTDLHPIKKFIDAYDKINSDFANNILDFQEVYFTLKNYHGQDLDQFMQEIKKMKAVPVGEDGEVQSHQLKVPVEAKSKYLEMLRKDIYEFGMAVDVQNIATGNATVVAIQSMYENLNFKASDFEQELQAFWRQVLTLTNEFNKALGNNVVLDNELVFDKSMISNINEIYERLSKWIGTLPDEILFKLLPDVDETEAMELLEEEKNQLMIQEE